MLLVYEVPVVEVVDSGVVVVAVVPVVLVVDSGVVVVTVVPGKNINACGTGSLHW